MIPAYEVRIKERARQYKIARATLERQHPNLDQEESERVELTALLSDLEHPQMLPPLGDAIEVDGADFLIVQGTRKEAT